MVEHGVYPWCDTFSFTAQGQLWLNHEWLAECGMYLVYQALGFEGLHALRIVLLFVVFWMGARSAVLLGASEPAAATAAGLALLNAQWRFFFDVRPYLFTYLGLALTMLFALRWIAGGRALWLVGLVPLYALWANLHSGVLAGLAMLTIFGFGSLPTSRVHARGLALAVAGCAAACLLNPFGRHILTFPFQFFGATIWAAGLNEWARTDLLGAQWCVAVYLVFGLMAAWVERRRLGLPMLLVTLAFGALSCAAWRHVPLFAIVSIPAIGLLTQRVVGFVGIKTPGKRLTRRLSWATLVMGLGALLWLLRDADLGRLSLEERFFPIDAVRFLEANPLPGRIYNAYGWGGYIAWKLGPRYRVFMDGRANTLYASEVYVDYLRIDAGAPDWRELLDRYAVGTVMLNEWERSLHADGGLFRALAASPQWGRIYADDISEIYVRRDPSTTSLWEAARAGRLWLPVAARLYLAREALEQGRLDASEETLRALLTSKDAEARACTLLAVVEVRRGHPLEAEALLRRAIRVDPQVPEAHFNLGALLMARGDVKAAFEMVEEEVRVNPGFQPARERLAQMRHHD